MHKINLKKPLTFLDGNPILEAGKEMELAKAIAGALIQSQSKNPLKTYEICQKLYKDGNLEIDTIDLEEFKESIKSNESATDLLKGQVLQEIAKQVK